MIDLAHEGQAPVVGDVDRHAAAAGAGADAAAEAEAAAEIGVDAPAPLDLHADAPREVGAVRDAGDEERGRAVGAGANAKRRLAGGGAWCRLVARAQDSTVRALPSRATSGTRLRAASWSPLSAIAAPTGCRCRLFTRGCPGPDSNRHGPFGPEDFKSSASTDFATRAGARQLTTRDTFASCPSPRGGSPASSASTSSKGSSPTTPTGSTTRPTGSTSTAGTTCAATAPASSPATRASCTSPGAGTCRSRCSRAAPSTAAATSSCCGIRRSSRCAPTGSSCRRRCMSWRATPRSSPTSSRTSRTSPFAATVACSRAARSR